MPAPGPSAQSAVGRDHGFHAVRVAAVVEETAEAASFVLDVPCRPGDPFAYEAGQFVTVRVPIEGHQHLRCYSMSSSPGVDDRFQVTVKRVPGGLVSNWLLDHVHEGDDLDVTLPAGVFCLPADGTGDVVGFAAGSGITPVHSILKAALAGGRRSRLLYANRDRASTIFAGELDHLVAEHDGRLEVVHHHDVESGFVDAAAVRAFLGEGTDVDVFVCGPTPFMDVVEGAVLDAGVDAERFHIERFTPAAPLDPAEAGVAAEPAGDTGTTITIELDGRTATTDHHPGTTILQAARQAGLAPPFSCESGSCATCMAKLEEGTCSMFVNNALTDDEVAEGWILTCQSVPTSPTVHVVYEGA